MITFSWMQFLSSISRAQPNSVSPHGTHSFRDDQGMEVGGRDCEAGAAVVEVFVRSAMTLPRRPAVLILEATPNNDHCGPKLTRVVRQNRM